MTPLVEPPRISQPTPQSTGFVFVHSFRDRMHPLQVILEVIAPTELLAVASAVIV